MHSHRMYVLFGLILAFTFGVFSVSSLAAAPEYAITATNVTMPPSGYGTSQFTITGIPAAGTISIGCQHSGPVTEAKIPQYCGTLGVSPEYPVTAGETLTGVISFVPYGEVPPPAAVSLRRAPHHPSYLPAAGLALAGALLLGFGSRRKASRWLVFVLSAASTLATVAGISACSGSSSNGMTPGSYPYEISAAFVETGTNVIVGTSTTIDLTVP
ncbi:MAG: hypothetical protein ACLQLH_08260 [Terracidiphilus sp.]